MISHELLSASAYNGLPEIDGLAPIADADLVGLGEIFVAHGLQHQLGASLLHRHYNLEEGEVMVHDGLRCSPQALGSHNTTLGGSSFFLNHNQFSAFEYDTLNPLQVKGDFLEDVASYLTGHGLAHRLALSKLDQQGGRLMETQDDETRAHVCREMSDNEPSTAHEVTEWRFEAGEGLEVRPVAARMCKTTSSGAHKRTK
jgi:hypothetical protein